MVQNKTDLCLYHFLHKTSSNKLFFVRKKLLLFKKFTHK